MAIIAGEDSTGVIRTVRTDAQGKVYTIPSTATTVEVDYTEADNAKLQLLSDILKEMKKMNLQLQIITDIKVDNEEVD